MRGRERRKEDIKHEKRDKKIKKISSKMRCDEDRNEIKTSKKADSMQRRRRFVLMRGAQECEVPRCTSGPIVTDPRKFTGDLLRTYEMGLAGIFP